MECIMPKYIHMLPQLNFAICKYVVAAPHFVVVFDTVLDWRLFKHLSGVLGGGFRRPRKQWNTILVSGPRPGISISRCGIA